jgi:glutamate decarboxylase
MKQGGWAVPAYHFCADRANLEIIRIIIRNAFSRDLAQMFLKELGRAVGRCDGTGEDPGRPTATNGGASPRFRPEWCSSPSVGEHWRLQALEVYV